MRTVEKLNLSEHILNVNIRKCSYDKFRFSDIEDYVRAVSGGREYQYQAIKQTMIYLWGEGYKDVAELALENANMAVELVRLVLQGERGEDGRAPEEDPGGRPFDRVHHHRGLGSLRRVRCHDHLRGY